MESEVQIFKQLAAFVCFHHHLLIRLDMIVLNTFTKTCFDAK